MDDVETKILEDLLDHEDALQAHEEVIISTSRAAELDYNAIIAEMEALPPNLLLKLLNRL